MDQFKDWKYTLASGEKKEVETEFNEYSTIYNGKRVVANEFGVAVYDEAKDKFLFGVGIDPDKENLQDYEFRKRSISPTGRYVWGESRKYRYLIDVENQTFQSEEVIPRAMGELRYFEILGKDANYVRDGAARVLLSKLSQDKKMVTYQKWKQTGGTGQSATDSSLYNAFANDGDFVKGGAL